MVYLAKIKVMLFHKVSSSGLIIQDKLWEWALAEQEDLFLIPILKKHQETPIQCMAKMDSGGQTSMGLISHLMVIWTINN